MPGSNIAEGLWKIIEMHNAVFFMIRRLTSRFIEDILTKLDG
jgi:hypothetical protein